MEQQETENQTDLLNTGVGTKEQPKLTASPVTIKEMEVRPVGENNYLKLALKVKHPNREDLLEISGIKYENSEELKEVGLWVKYDDDGNIQKGSPVAVLLNHCGVSVPAELKEKEIQTAEGKKGYLVVKAY